jgi:hypothetical protein
VSDPNQQAEVKIKLVIDGNATKAMNSLTGEVVKATTSEEEYQKRLAKRRHVIEENRKAEKESARLEADLIRSGHLRPKTTIGELADRYQSQRQQQEQLRSELQRRGLAPRDRDTSPMGLARERIENEQKARQVQREYERMKGVGQSQGLLGSIGQGSQSMADKILSSQGINIPPGATKALAAAAVLHIAKKTMDGIVQFGKIDADAFMTERQKAESKSLANPFLGGAFSFYADVQRYRSGDNDRLATASRQDSENQVRSQFDNEIGGRLLSGRFERDSARFREQAFKGFVGARPEFTGDRTTVLGRRLFEEDQQTMGARQQIKVAEAERAAAIKTAANAAFNEDQTRVGVRVAEEEFAAMQLARRANEKRYSGKIGDINSDLGLKTSSQEFAFREAESARRLDMARSRYDEALSTRKQSDLDVLGRTSALAGARSQFSQAQLGIAQGREDRAQSQAQTLGSLGPIGRMQSKFALERFSALGIDALTQEEISAASAAAPDTIRRAQEESGKRFVNDFRQLAPEEFRDDLGDARKRTDEARRKAREDQDFAVEQGTKGVADVLGQGLDKLIDAIKKKVDDAIQKLERDTFIRNNS